METNCRPTPDLSKSPFRGIAEGGAIEDPDNPFLEPSDFAPATKPAPPQDRSRPRDRERPR